MDGLAPALWLASSTIRPHLSSGRNQAFAHNAAADLAVMTSRLRIDERDPAELLPALGALVQSLTYRLSQVRNGDSAPPPDLVDAENRPPDQFRRLRLGAECLIIDGTPYLAYRWNLGEYRVLTTVAYPFWVSVLVPRGLGPVGLVSL